LRSGSWIYLKHSLKMTKFSNVLKAGGLMMGLVWGMYGNTDVTQVVPAKAAKAPVATAQETKVNPVAEVTDYPTVLKRTVVDLTDAPSRTRSVSAPFKSDEVDDVDLP